jgi:hypothetical protein
MERELGFDLDVRPTSIALKEWLALFDQLQQVSDAHIRQRLAGSEQRLLQQQCALQKIHRTRTVERKM